MAIIAISGGEAKVAIDGKRFLDLLNLDEKIVTAEDISEKLLSLSDEERAKIFNECIVEDSEAFEILNRTKKDYEDIFSMPSNDEFFYHDNLGYRPPSEIKKELKYEKNPMRIKQLQKELNNSLVCLKRGW